MQGKYDGLFVHGGDDVMGQFGFDVRALSIEVTSFFVETKTLYGAPGGTYD